MSFFLIRIGLGQFLCRVGIMILAALILDVVMWLRTVRRCGFGDQSIPFALGSIQVTPLYPQATVPKEMLFSLYFTELFVCCAYSCSVVVHL